jgi:hypothetical protein
MKGGLTEIDKVVFKLVISYVIKIYLSIYMKARESDRIAVYPSLYTKMISCSKFSISTIQISFICIYL